MAPEEEVMDEFSLMDIKKLIQNYPKRKLELSYPHFSIFLLWIGRICKSPAFSEFYLILGEFMAEYYSVEANRAKGEATYDNWKNFFKHYDAKKYDPDFLAQIAIFDEKSCKKFVEYFVQWADLFRALSI
jgi:hypothetical protein